MQIRTLCLSLLLAIPGRATVLDSLAPGTIGFEVHQELGEPTNGMNAIQERYTARDKGIVEAECWYDKDGFIRFSRIRLVSELSPRVARLLFDITEGPRIAEGHAIADNEVEGATTISYSSAGVHFVSVENIVKEIWRTKSRWTTEQLKKATNYTYKPETAIEAVVPTTGESPTNPTEAGGTRSTVSIQQPNVTIAAPQTGQGPPRLLQITNTWFEITGNVMQGQNIRVFAKVTSANLAGEMLDFTVHLRRPGGTILPAGRGAPPAHVGDNGVFKSSFREKALYANSAWESANVLVPLNLINDPGGRHGIYIVNIKAECGGLQSICETTCFVVGPGYTQFPPVQRFEIGKPIFEMTENPQYGPGYMLKFPLTVHGCRNTQITGYLELHGGGGALVQASDAWPAFKAKDGRLYSLRQEKVLYDLSRWNPYQLYFPQASLPGGAGTRQRYSARFIGRCNGLQVSFDVEYDFQTKARLGADQR